MGKWIIRDHQVDVAKLRTISEIDVAKLRITVISTSPYDLLAISL